MYDANQANLELTAAVLRRMRSSRYGQDRRLVGQC